MKKILSFFALAALLFSSCEKTPEEPTPQPGEYKVKLAEALQPITLISSATEAEVGTIAVKCLTEGFKTPISISFTVDPSLVPEGAVMLPAEAFTLSDDKAVIQPGTDKAEITVSVKVVSSLLPSTRYVVPIKLSCDSEYVEVQDKVVNLEVSLTLAPYDIQVKSATVDAVALNSADLVATTRTIEVECTNSKMYGSVNVAISVDAAAVPTGKVLLPEAAYAVPATISIDPDTKKGSVELSVSPTADLTNEAYVIPLRISSTDSGVNIPADKSLVIVEVSFTKCLAAIPITGPEGGLSACTEFFSMQGKYLIARYGTTGKVLRFEYNAATRTLDNGTEIGTGWTAASVRLFGPGPGNTIHYVTADNMWFVQQLPDDCSSLKAFDDASRKLISTGCSIFLFQLYGAHSAGMVFINRSSGSLFLYPTTADGLTLSGGKTDTGATFNFWKTGNYRFVFIYKDDVYGVGPDPGSLWRHKYDPATKTFSLERTEVGQNWAQFLQITQLGDDLVVHKGNATLDLYQFDPDNYNWDANYKPAS